MRGGTVAVVGAALLGALTACSPGHNATLAVGYDATGRLIAAANVYHHSVDQAELLDSGATVGTWERVAPLEHLETWPLLEGTGGPWASGGSELAGLESKGHYELSLWSSNHAWGNHLEFAGRDLAHLVPGEVLVERVRQDRPGGPATTTLEIIPLDELAAESCSE